MAISSDVKAYIAQEGGKLAGSILKAMIGRPHKIATKEEPSKIPASVIVPVTQPLPVSSTIIQPAPVVITKIEQGELDYRWECCMKHLGGANVLLREAYERAIDEGIGNGTAEKIMEAMNEHAGMEADLEKMLSIPEAKEQAERLLSGVRAFRRAAWEVKLPTGGGTKDDIADARLWNNVLYQEAYNSANKQPGAECIRMGM